MLLLGTKNAIAQTVAAGSAINLGAVYRKYCKRNACGIKAFDFNGMSITLNHQGMYHITATMVVTGGAAGLLAVGLYENENEVESAYASETITTAATEYRTLVIDYYVLVDNTSVLNQTLTTPKTITFRPDGITTNVQEIIVNVEKVV